MTRDPRTGRYAPAGKVFNQQQGTLFDKGKMLRRVDGNVRKLFMNHKQRGT